MSALDHRHRADRCRSAARVVAAVGLNRFDGVLMRIHAASKPQTLGLMFVFTGVALVAQSWSLAGFLLVVLLAQMGTVPVASVMVAAPLSGAVSCAAETMPSMSSATAWRTPMTMTMTTTRTDSSTTTRAWRMTPRTASPRTWSTPRPPPGP